MSIFFFSPTKFFATIQKVWAKGVKNALHSISNYNWNGNFNRLSNFFSVALHVTACQHHTYTTRCTIHEPADVHFYSFMNNIFHHLFVRNVNVIELHTRDCIGIRWWCPLSSTIANWSQIDTTTIQINWRLCFRIFKNFAWF